MPPPALGGCAHRESNVTVVLLVLGMCVCAGCRDMPVAAADEDVERAGELGMELRALCSAALRNAVVSSQISS